MSQVFVRMSYQPPRLVVAPAGARRPSVVHAVTGTPLLVLARESRKVAAGAADGGRIHVLVAAGSTKTSIEDANNHTDDSTSGDGRKNVDLMDLVEQKTHSVLNVLKELSLRHDESHREGYQSREKNRKRLREDCVGLLVQMKRGDQVAVSTLIHIQLELKAMIGSPMRRNMFDRAELNTGNNLPGSCEEEESTAVTLVLDMIRQLDEVFQAYDEYKKHKQGRLEEYINGDRAI